MQSPREVPYALLILMDGMKQALFVLLLICARMLAGWSPIVAFVLVLVDDIGMLSVCEVYEVDGVLAPLFEYNHDAE